MQRSTTLLIAALGAGVATMAAMHWYRTEQTERRWAMLETYCADCHNDDDRAGELTFADLTPASIPEHAEVFEAVVEKLRGRLMPPPGREQPEPTRR